MLHSWNDIRVRNDFRGVPGYPDEEDDTPTREELERQAAEVARILGIDFYDPSLIAIYGMPTFPRE